MKRMIAVLVVLMLCLGVAQAAGWENGTSPAQPYPGVPEADLQAQMGYKLAWPREGAAAQMYCDTLYIYLPRQDVALGEGTLRLMDADGEVCAVSFSDAKRVSLAPLDEQTLSDLAWGEGVGIGIRLPVSLALGADEYITLDEGCYTAADGKVVNGAVSAEEPWRPLVEGDFGVGSLRFVGASGEIKDAPGAGDAVQFDLALGGEATLAALESANGSITCDAGNSFETSQTLTLNLTDDDFAWTVYFMNASGEIVDYLTFDRDMVVG